MRVAPPAAEARRWKRVCGEPAEDPRRPRRTEECEPTASVKEGPAEHGDRKRERQRTKTSEEAQKPWRRLRISLLKNQAMAAQLQQQGSAMQQLQAQLVHLQSQITAAGGQASPRQLAGPGAGSGSRTTFAIDTRVIGKPREFDVGRVWKDWSVIFRSYVVACHESLGELMRRAADTDEELSNITLGAADKHMGAQLFYMLVTGRQRGYDRGCGCVASPVQAPRTHKLGETRQTALGPSVIQC